MDKLNSNRKQAKRIFCLISIGVQCAIEKFGVTSAIISRKAANTIATAAKTGAAIAPVSFPG